jgi:hypothetical protein
VQIWSHYARNSKPTYVSNSTAWWDFTKRPTPLNFEPMADLDLLANQNQFTFKVNPTPFTLTP